MDRDQEEMQNLGIFGIYFEAYRIIVRQKTIFIQITLFFILPLSLIFLSHHEISHYLNLNTMINHHEEIILQILHHHTFSSSHLTIQCIFNIFYFTFFLIISLFSTSAVVYTVASTYTGQEITFKNVMTVVPKVWKRVMITFLCTFVAFFAYNVIALAALWLWFISLVDSFVIDIAILVIMFFIYTVGFIYMSIIWNLASVVSVLGGDLYGIKAMIKSKELIKGKKMLVITLVMFLKLNLSMGAVQILFDDHVVIAIGSKRKLGFILFSKIGLGIICLLVLLKLILFGFVMQTIVYFVCKSYHHEKIDKSALSDHLEVYLGQYVPLMPKDVQLVHAI